MSGGKVFDIRSMFGVGPKTTVDLATAKKITKKDKEAADKAAAAADGAFLHSHSRALA